MKVILNQKVGRLGERGNIVNVTDGYARNYLLPKKLAILATPANIKRFEQEEELQKNKEEKEKILAEKIAEKLNNMTVTVIKKAGEEILFGSVTTADIAELLEKEGFSIDKRKILILESIKKLGEYQVSIKLHPEVSTQINLVVIREES
jgi:large subunit ribosomal protein L9